MFFQLISALHEQASLIITSNIRFEDLAELLGDLSFTVAILNGISISPKVLVSNNRQVKHNYE